MQAAVRGPRSTRSSRTIAAAAPLFIATAWLTGCASSESQAAADAARQFAREIRSDPVSACELLAPGTRDELESSSETDCPAALAEAGLPEAGAPVSTVVAGHSAQVVLESDTVFLALFEGGWRVTAAGCTAQDHDRALPYDCIVTGG
jgi:hypothetical protein